MATRLLGCARLTIVENVLFNTQNNIKRHGHRMRGKAPDVARTLEQRLNEMIKQDEAVSYRVDIGFPSSSKSRSDQLYERMAHIKKLRSDTELEKLARNQLLEVNLSDVRKDWLETIGPFHIRRIADHYSVYEHLFGDAYFIPRVNLQVFFEQPFDYSCPVFYGNIIKPSDAKEKPIIEYDASKDDLYTLVLTNPDGNFTEEDKEYVHLFIANIPGSDVSKGETIVPYLQPIPPKGTGYHRYIFILYKQDKTMDFTKLKVDNSTDLTKRSFKTLDFYRENQDFITPAGLCFFQSDWDQTLTDFYHKVLNMKEPRYEYDFPEPYLRPQEWFPRKRPFNKYMDKYRDPKEINKEYLMEKLKKVHPFEEPEKELMFPNAQPFDRSTYLPSWLREKIKKDRQGIGRINEIK